MTLSNIISFITGLGLFILGMYKLTTGLHIAASNNFKIIISNYKLNPILGLIIGAVATAILQSSSGTTVIVVGLVEANILSLHQATSIIMGANIGTTFTGQLLALNASKYLSLFIIVGLVFIFFFPKKYAALGTALIGFSLIFIGIDNMQIGLGPLEDVVRFKEILLEFRNVPILGLAMGFLTTAIIQSSSTGVALLQTLSTNRLITLQAAIPIVIGLNIGTCVTTLISSIPLSKSGKRAAIIHLLFNTFGALIIFPFINTLGYIVTYLSQSPPQQIAHAHSLFNIISSIIFLPSISIFVWLSCIIIKK